MSKPRGRLKKAHTARDMDLHYALNTHTCLIFPYVGITQIRCDRSKFDYFLSACSTSSLLYLSISLEDGICQAISSVFSSSSLYFNPFIYICRLYNMAIISMPFKTFYVCYSSAYVTEVIAYFSLSPPTPQAKASILPIFYRSIG